MIAYMGATPSEIMHCENFIDRQGNIWASFDNAVYQITFSKADYHIYKKVGDAAGTDFTGDVRCITRLKDGTLLVGTKAKQLIRYTKGTFMGLSISREKCNCRLRSSWALPIMCSRIVMADCG